MVVEDKKVQARKVLNNIYPNRSHNNYLEEIKWQAIQSILHSHVTIIDCGEKNQIHTECFSLEPMHHGVQKNQKCQCRGGYRILSTIITNTNESQIS